MRNSFAYPRIMKMRRFAALSVSQENRGYPGSIGKIIALYHVFGVGVFFGLGKIGTWDHRGKKIPRRGPKRGRTDSKRYSKLIRASIVNASFINWSNNNYFAY
jgi:hypothetical protein